MSGEEFRKKLRCNDRARRKFMAFGGERQNYVGFRKRREGGGALILKGAG